MRIQLASDLHREFLCKSDREKAWEQLKQTDAEVLVLVGDIETATTDDDWIRFVATQYPNVLYVLGNHEFYHGVWQNVRHRWQLVTEQVSNLHVLDNQAITIGDVRFVGSTLWTDYNGRSERLLHEVKKFMADYHVIKDESGRQLKAGQLLLDHDKSVAFLKSELKEYHDGKVVVLTHMAPSNQSVHSKYARNFLNGCFYTDLEDMIHLYEPVLWAHGHMHDSFSYKIGKTQVRCNPFGYYMRDWNRDFDAKLILEV